MKAHLLPISTVFDQLKTSEKGLSSAEAGKRIEKNTFFLSFSTLFPYLR